MLLKRKNNKEECKEQLTVGAVLVLAVALYNFVWLNKSFTMSEGWAKVYTEMFDQGKLPYRDYFYFLPLFSLGLDYLFWKLSFGYFIIFRCLRLAERVLITLIMYKTLNKKIPSDVSATICFCGTVMAAGNVYDLVGDFNQTVQLLIILLTVFLIKYFEDEKRNRKWLFLCGIIGGLMFGTKQTVTLASAIVFTVMFIVLFWLKEEKNIFKDLLIVVAGALIPMLILGIYLVLTHSLTEYIYYVFQNTGSKGTLYEIIVKSQLGIIGSRVFSFIAILNIFFVRILNDFFEDRKYTRILQLLSIFTGLFFFVYSYGVILMNALVIDFESFHLLVLLAVVVLIIYFSKNEWVYLLLLFIYSCILFINYNCNTERIYNSGIFDLIVEFMSLLYMYLFCWVIYTVAKSIIKRERIELDKFVLASGTIAAAFTTAMATGVSATSSIIAFIGIPTLFYIELESFHYFERLNIDSKKFLSITAKLVTFVVFSICLSQKIVCCYAWWGDTEGPLWDKKWSSDIECLKGFKFTEKEIERYDRLYEVIRDNTNEESIIYSFPYAKVYNIFLENYNTNTFAPVAFYDVCPDDVAISDAAALSAQNPDIIVWLDIPSCMEVHETLFRGGDQLGQREIQKWFSSVKDSNYTLIGQVDNVFVYKLNDGTEIATTYIKRKTVINETASYPINEKIICELVGEGTLEKPYEIGSYDSLVYFRDLVNMGYSFYGEYVRQTADIDMSGCDNWTPIGILGSEKLFEGFYDGDGYLISNLSINTEENSGFFGQLAGTVVNVVIDNCDISAICTGGIASHGVNSRIINCLVVGSISGFRVGGIADNMGEGYLGNCVSNVTLSGEYKSGISGYYSNTIENCYSNYGNDISYDDGYAFTNDSIEKLNEFVKEKNEDYNDLLNTWKYAGEYPSLSHKD